MSETIKLKYKKSSQEEHPGYGAGAGYIMSEEYECPCGKGTVYYEKDDIPGFRDKQAWTSCSECKEKYWFGESGAELRKTK